jgi:C-terminal processing protease CtpA/Prc
MLRCLLVLVLGLSACRSAPIHPIPEPLPETLAWARPTGPTVVLGLHGEENSSGSLEDLSFEPGLRVTSVVEHSPATRAGIRLGDVVLAIGEQTVNDPEALDVWVQALGEGQVTLQMQRGDSIFDVPVELALLEGPISSDVKRVARVDPGRSRARWFTTRDGVLLAAAHGRSPFPAGGVPVGSWVTHLDGDPVVSDLELIRNLRTRSPGSSVDVTAVTADGDRLERRVRLADSPTRVTKAHLPILFDYESSVDGTRNHFSFIDLWVFQLFRTERDGQERRWVLLEVFGFELIQFATGQGELTE